MPRSAAAGEKVLQNASRAMSTDPHLYPKMALVTEQAIHCEMPMLSSGRLQKKSNSEGDAKKSGFCRSQAAHQRATTISRSARAMRREFSQASAASTASLRRVRYRAQRVKTIGESRIEAANAGVVATLKKANWICAMKTRKFRSNAQPKL